MLKSPRAGLVSGGFPLRPVIAAPLSLLVLAVMASGCLFPPIAVEATPPGEDAPIVAPAPPVFAQDEFRASREGRVTTGATLPTGGNQNAELHAFELPARLIAIEIELDWSDTVMDLDLAAQLRRSGPDADRILWSDENEAGETGNPDAPARLTTSERERILLEEGTTLHVSVTAKASLDVPYTLSVRALYLVPQP